MDQNIEELVADGIIVQPYYMMDPETETLVRSRALRNGMKVLIESPTIKSDLTQASMYDDAGHRQMLAYNRWCVVTDLEFVPRRPYTRDTEAVSFIGVYDDGTMITLHTSIAHNWYVKKDSIPEDQEESWTDPNEELTESKDPQWVQQLENKWRDEKGTSTGGGLIENLGKI